MRLFIAVPLQKDVQRSVYAYQSKIEQVSSQGRFVPLGNHHITLRFLGQSDALYDITSAMHEAVKDARPFLLHLGEYGYFTHGGARTSYLTVTGELEEMYRIHTILETELWERGFDKGKGRLKPHITLARGVEHGDIGDIQIPNDGFRIGSIVLCESQNQRGRQIYTPIHTESF
ncbi:MAG: RNA 2',3'-cyclic phosphodiesterase [Eubacteriales bacterium]|nr:RNA 2',3'-cyclic phosphodiesterase [Eubacteriales bacterium]